MSSSGPPRLRPGPVAVGLAFLVHPLEEAATDFPLWFRATLGGDLDPVTFAVINTVGFFVVTGAVALHRRRDGAAAATGRRPAPPDDLQEDGYGAFRPGSLDLVPAAVGALFLLNAAIHATAALLTLSYVPGVVTGVLVWAPLGLVLLREGRDAGGAVLRRGIALGVAAQVLVTLTALLA